MVTAHKQKELKKALNYIEEKLKQSDNPIEDFEPLDIEVKSQLSGTVKEISLYFNVSNSRVELRLLSDSIIAYYNGERRYSDLRTIEGVNSTKNFEALKSHFIELADINGFEV